MTRINRLLLAVGLATSVVWVGAAGFAESTPGAKPFVVFDGTMYSNKPDLSEYGIKPISIAYAGKFGAQWHHGDIDRLPDAESIRAVAQEMRSKGHMVVIDIEHWPLTGSPDSVRKSVAKYTSVLESFRAAALGISLGYYGVPPIRDYWRAIKPLSSQEYQTWMAENDRLRSLARVVDAFFPSLYTFYADQEGWKRYAIAQINEARRYGDGKPVYVFLWPQYHESNRMLGGSFLPADYWRLELETARQYADGIIIWGGWGQNNRPAQWDEAAPWWTITKEFMKRSSAAQSGGGSPH